jgi:hypothetical protein
MKTIFMVNHGPTTHATAVETTMANRAAITPLISHGPTDPNRHRPLPACFPPLVHMNVKRREPPPKP